MDKIRSVSVKQMRLIDKMAVSNGIPIELMMENAGRAIASSLKNRFGDLYGKKILCIAGKGNNGGGVIASIRHLVYYGAKVTLFLVFPKSQLSGPAKFHLSSLSHAKLKVILNTNMNRKEFFSKIQNTDIIIDGIFGTGFHGKIDDFTISAIHAINKSGAYILSNDVPSGINADTGHVDSVSVNADFTVVLHRPKKWMHKMNLSRSKYSIESIGIPSKL